MGSQPCGATSSCDVALCIHCSRLLRQRYSPMEPSNPNIDLHIFPLRYRPAASRAVAGSTADLKQISSAIRGGHIPLTRDTLEVFLHHLKTSQNPSDSGTRLQLVETVLREITQFFYNAEGNPGNSIISSFSDSWPAICSRLYELHGHNKTSVRSSSSGPERDVLSLILAFITTVSQWPDMTTCLRAPRQLEQVISILARIWTSESKSKPKNLDIPSSHALVSFMHSGTENAYMEETACAFITYFQTKSTVAKLLLGHLETSSKWLAPYYKHFNSDAFLVGLLIIFDEELK
ncbi:hypothetical protein B0H13DRAFT_438553 [Mycena leptocephala]|nr:hypothetical protein B0H13DRAFT_438553 [Mycena leptocephala]